MSAAGYALMHDRGADRMVRALAAEVGFSDPVFRGELATLFDGRGRSLRYLRPSGVNLDRFAELLWDRGITGRRLDIRETIELLELAFDDTAAKKPKKGRVRKSAAIAGIEADAAKAKRNRLRKFVCPDCGMILRGAYLTADGRETRPACGYCDGRPIMHRVDPTFTEVMNQTGAAEAVPF